MSRLKKFYNRKVVKKLVLKFNYTSVMQVPRIKKIVLNMGVGAAITDKKMLQYAISDLSMISGQKPMITIARKSVAGFKIRKGHSIGCKVTLRKKRKWDFFDRLISIVIPRIRDFRGFSRSSFDGRGNYNFGIKEQIIFPEINYDKVDRLRGLNVTISTTSSSDAEGYSLLSSFNFPFRNTT